MHPPRFHAQVDADLVAALGVLAPVFEVEAFALLGPPLPAVEPRLPDLGPERDLHMGCAAAAQKPRAFQITRCDDEHASPGSPRLQRDVCG